MVNAGETADAAPSIRSSRVNRSSDQNDATNAQDDQQQPQQQSTETEPFKPSRRLWFVLMCIGAVHLCGAVEGTIINNALPTISTALGGGSLYLWVPNAFYLASIAALPLYSQMSDIFGRRRLLLGAMCLYVLGCALGGASTSMRMLIAARAIQGLGSGGVDTLCDTVVMDLVPLRLRSQYMSILSVGTMVGFASGPFLGGVIVEKLGWPWIFYLTAILGGFALILFFFFLRVKSPRGQSFMSKFKRIDFGGNAIFVGAVVAVLLALTWGGPVYRWESAQILVPLIVGLLGLCAFTAFEWTPRLAPEPSFPRVIVSNRTSSAALAMNFVNSIIASGTFYFLPVYFQGVLAKSPLDSGIALAPISAALIPFAAVAGILLSKVGKYRPIHIFGWSVTLVSVGLCSILDRHSSAAAWACFQILGAAGIGALVATLFTAVQAPLTEREVATSAGIYTFSRSFGQIWGVTIPSVVFNNVVKRQVTTKGLNLVVNNSTLASRLATGQAYQLATKAFLDSLPPSDNLIREQVIGIFEHALHVVFYVLTAFAGLGFLLVLLEKEIPMRTANKTEFGLDEGGGGTNDAVVDDGERYVGDAIAAIGRSRRSDESGANSRVADIIPLEEVNGQTR